MKKSIRKRDGLLPTGGSENIRRLEKSKVPLEILLRIFYPVSDFSRHFGEHGALANGLKEGWN